MDWRLALFFYLSLFFYIKHSSSYSFNPILSIIFGFKFYEAEDDTGVSFVLLSTKPLTNAKIKGLRVKKLTEHTYMIVYGYYLELLAITASEIPTRLIKIDIDAPAQTVVENLFRTQRSEFINEDIEEIEFCASYNVQDGEIFSINPFDDEIGIINAIERPDAVPVWDPDDVSVHYFKALFTGEPASIGNPTLVWLQCFDRRQIINNEKSFFQVVTQPGNRFSVSTRPGFSLSDRLTAILVGDKLLFKSFFMLRRFFNMEEYFNEATREDLDNFIGNDIFHVENAEDFMMFADSAIKKKVSLIISSGILNDQPIENLIECAQKIGYQLGITNVNGDNKITMPNSKREVKQLLYFLDQGYFNSIITNELMLTNSKRPIRI